MIKYHHMQIIVPMPPAPHVTTYIRGHYRGDQIIEAILNEIWHKGIIILVVLLCLIQLQNHALETRELNKHWLALLCFADIDAFGFLGTSWV